MFEKPPQAASYKAGWMAVDAAGDPAAFVRFMDRFRPPAADTLDAYRPAFDLRAVRQGERILDVGCGTGGAVRALAELTGSSGLAAGIDLSATMIEEALRRSAPQRAAAEWDKGSSFSQRAAAEQDQGSSFPSSLPVEFRVADAQALPYDDGAFDGCYSGGSLEIMDGVERALAEMVRVIRPGGRLVVTGTDVGTWAIDAADRRLTRRILDFICDHERNGWLGRQLARLCREQGLVEVIAVPDGRITTDFALLSQLWLQTHLANAQRAGVLTAAEAAAWLGDLQARAERGELFFSSTLFVVRGLKPGPGRT